MIADRNDDQFRASVERTRRSATRKTARMRAPSDQGRMYGCAASQPGSSMPISLPPVPKHSLANTEFFAPWRSIMEHRGFPAEERGQEGRKLEAHSITTTNGTSDALVPIMPIQRHAALAPFSRDHHLALQLARGIQVGGSHHLRDQLPGDPKGLVAHVQRVFAEEIEPHFVAEETVLLPAIAGRAADLDAVAREVVTEHDEMRSMIHQLTRNDLPPDTVNEILNQLGRLLEAHVRKEERALYEKIQAVLDEPALARMSLDIERHLRVHQPPARAAEATRTAR